MDQKASGTEWSERPSTILDFFFAFLDNFECPWISDTGRSPKNKETS